MNNLEKLFEINPEYKSGHVLKTKSMIFSIKILEFSEYLLEHHSAKRIADQILRSGTSIGANASEADFGESKADFIHKLAISQKETNETKYWICVCFAKGYIKETYYTELFNDANELLKIITKSITTAKSNMSLKSKPR